MDDVLKTIRYRMEEDEDEEDIQYRSCCGRLRSTWAAGLIGVLECIGVIYFIISAAIMNANDDEDGYYGRKVLVVIYAMIVVNLIVVLAPLFLGLRYERAWLLVFHLAKDVWFFFLSLTGAGVIIVALGTLATGAATLHGAVPVPDFGLTPIGEAKGAFSKAKSYLIGSFLVCLIYAALQVWFFLIVLSAFRCLRAKAKRRNDAGGFMSDAPPPYSV